MKKALFLVMAVFAMATVCDAQKVTLKTNIPAWAGVAPNVGVEFAISPKWTVGIEGMAFAFNPYNNFYANGWMGTGEVRYYTCKAFNGHHFGLYGNVGRFGDLTATGDLLSKVAMGGLTPEGAKNVKVATAGLSYGYYFKLGTHWAIDTTIGVGGNYAMANGGIKSGVKFGLSRLQVALVYRF